MLDERFVFVGVLLNIIGGLSYLRETIKGKTKPNRVSWFLWAVAPFIAFSAEVKQGVGIQSLLTFMVGLNPFLIFIASFINRKSYWKVSSLDIICAVFSVIGIVMWLVTRVGNIAILFSILADGLASIPTIIKSYKAPETENSTIFLMGGLSALITLSTIRIWNFEHFGFPLYIFFICLILYVLITYRKGNRNSTKTHK